MSDLVKVTCPSQPSLWIPHLGVQFVDGEASVTVEQAEALRPYTVHGVCLGGDDPASEADPAPEAGPEQEPEPEAAKEPVPTPKATSRRRSSKPFG